MLEHTLKPITYACGIFLTFIVVICIYMVKLDYDSQSLCNDAVVEFVDRSRASGYISATNYLEMMSKINSTNNIYGMTICHESQTCHPVVDGSGNAVVGKFDYTYNTYFDNEILDVVFPDDGTTNYGQYAMKNGDYLKVSYWLKEPTLGARIYSFWTTRQFKSIKGSYGGYVGSTEESR